MALDNVALARDGLVGCNLHGCELETGTGLLETRRAYLVAVGEATGQRREALVAKHLLLGVQHTKILTGEEHLAPSLVLAFVKGVKRREEIQSRFPVPSRVAYFCPHTAYLTKKLIGLTFETSGGRCTVGRRVAVISTIFLPSSGFEYAVALSMLQ